jgi:hypothetical protein
MVTPVRGPAAAAAAAAARRLPTTMAMAMATTDLRAGYCAFSISLGIGRQSMLMFDLA